MENIRILEWNVNQRTRNNEIKDFVINELLQTDQRPHIVFLVEYKEDKIFEEKLVNNGYRVFSTGKLNNRNEVLIAIIDNGMFVFLNEDIKDIPTSLDILPLLVKWGEKKICLVATRVEVATGEKAGTAEDYIDRGKQLLELKCFVELMAKKCDSVVIAGDFNHGQIREEENDKFDYEGYLQKPCSFQKIKKIFKKMNCTVYTPDGDNNSVFSWVGKWSDKKRGTSGLMYIKQDHLILSDDLYIYKNEIEYSWDFVERQIEYAEISKYDYKSDQFGNPDHAKLYAIIHVKK